MMRSRMWELIILLIIGGLMFKWFVETIHPLMPYIAGAVIAGAIAKYIHYRYSRW